MAEFELVAEERTELGKGANRRLRRTGKIPAVIYGAGEGTKSVSLFEREVLKQLETEAFYSHILEVKVGGKSEQAVLKALQRHPATAQILHMDLQRVRAEQVLHMHVPLHFENEERAPGKRAGGLIAHHVVEVEVACLPKDLPEYIAVDMSEVELGGAILLSELLLPDGVELVALTHRGEHTQDRPVVSIHMARVMEEEEAAAEEEEEGLEAAAGAPAEGAAGEQPKTGDAGEG